MLHDDLATASSEKYNNIVASKEYSKIDPKDAKTLALTTKVTAIKRSVGTKLVNVTYGCGSGGGYKVNQGDREMAHCQ